VLGSAIPASAQQPAPQAAAPAAPRPVAQAQPAAPAAPRPVAQAPQPAAPAAPQPGQAEAPSVPQTRNPRPLVPLEVQIVIARYQGEKRTSSMPYVLAVNANGRDAQLNMGTDVAIPTSVFATPGGDGKPAPAPLRSYNYRNIGTNIVCGATTTSADDGRYELTISIDDSSVFTKEDGGGSTSGGDMPAFRSFKTRNTLLMRDGQSRQYTAATDRVSNETIRVEVTMKVVK
jgi:hypothetical protein